MSQNSARNGREIL